MLDAAMVQLFCCFVQGQKKTHAYLLLETSARRKSSTQPCGHDVNDAIEYLSTDKAINVSCYLPSIRTLPFKLSLTRLSLV
jgi:hypothetical protein